MIGAQRVVDTALAEAARLGNADETIVLVTDRSDAALRWAGNSMTTNRESVRQTATVISIVRKGDTAHVGSVRSSDVDPALIAASVAASQQAAAAAPPGRRRGPPPPAAWGGRPGGRRRCTAAAGHRRTGRLGRAGAGHWCAGVLGVGTPSGTRFSGRGPVVRGCPAYRGDDVPGHVQRTAAALHAADRVGGDQRQT